MTHTADVMRVLLRAEGAAHMPSHAAGFLWGVRACQVLRLASHSGEHRNSRCHEKGSFCHSGEHKNRRCHEKGPLCHSGEHESSRCHEKGPLCQLAISRHACAGQMR